MPAAERKNDFQHKHDHFIPGNADSHTDSPPRSSHISSGGHEAKRWINVHKVTWQDTNNMRSRVFPGSALFRHIEELKHCQASREQTSVSGPFFQNKINRLSRVANFGND